MRFVGLTANPRIHADLFFEGDRNLYWIAMSRYLREFGNSLSRRLSSLVHRRTQSWAKT